MFSALTSSPMGAFMIVLFDQDGPLANETTRLFEIFRKYFPKEAARHSGIRTSFKLTDNFPSHLHDAIEEMRREQGFYLSFPPTKGGIHAFKRMLSQGHEVFICTSPLIGSEYCVPEKFEWVERHMGPEFVDRVVITKDKTTVRGDLLIDDRPEVTGNLLPVWEHIIFDAPYNRHIRTRRRLDWQNWKAVLSV